MSVPLIPEFSKSLTYLVEVETIAQDIVTLKEAKLDLANTLNKLRESYRALQTASDKYSFIKVGSLFFNYETEECKTIVQEEIDKVKRQYDTTCKELKEKLFKMRDIEHEPKIKGVGLSPLSYKEAESIMKGFGIK